MRLRVALATALAVATLATCGDDDTGGFSATTRSRYMEGCTTSQSAAFCECTLDELEQRFTEEEYLGFAVDASEQRPDDFVEVSLACLAEAELGG